MALDNVTDFMLRTDTSNVFMRIRRDDRIDNKGKVLKYRTENGALRFRDLEMGQYGGGIIEGCIYEDFRMVSFDTESPEYDAFAYSRWVELEDKNARSVKIDLETDKAYGSFEHIRQVLELLHVVDCDPGEFPG